LGWRRWTNPDGYRMKIVWIRWSWRKVYIFNIQPVDCPAMIECKTKNSTNGNRLNDRTKSFIKIDPSLLIISDKIWAKNVKNWKRENRREWILGRKKKNSIRLNNLHAAFCFLFSYSSQSTWIHIYTHILTNFLN